MKQATVFIGPLPPPFHGQSVAFNQAFQGFNGPKYVVNQNFGHFPFLLQIPLSCFAIGKFFMLAIIFSPRQLYITCSRSIAGSLFDVVILAISRWLNIDAIVHLHGADFKVFFARAPRFYQKIIATSYLRVKKIIVLFDDMRDQFAGLKTHAEFVVIPNCYAPEFDHPPLCPRSGQSTIQLLFLSNLCKTKGVFELFAACEQILKSHDNVHLKIAGTPIGDNEMSTSDATKQFHQQLSQLQTTNPGQITYLGVVTGIDKTDLLTDSDIFILPTYYPIEAMPISIIEAMRSGTAVITTDHNYLSQMIDSNKGLLVAPRSVSELTNAITNLLQDSQKLEEIKQYNRSFALENYSYIQFNARINSVLGDR